MPGNREPGRHCHRIQPDDEDVDVDALDAADLLAFSYGETVVYVIHEMDMTNRQKKQYRKK